MLIPVGEQKNSLRLGMKTFEDEQERIRRAEQARLEEEARKAAEEAALAQAVALEHERAQGGGGGRDCGPSGGPGGLRSENDAHGFR
jgi:hypothetical protein